MNVRSLRSLTTGIRVKATRRAGMIAVGEVLVVLASLAGVLWLITQMMAVIEDKSAAKSHEIRGCSERSVYRISLDNDGKKMWIYRPREGIFRLDVETGAVEDTRSTEGMDLNAVAHSGDGKTTILCGIDGTVVLHRDSEEPVVMYLGTETDVIVDSAVSSDGSLSLAVTTTGHLGGWRQCDGGLMPITLDLVGDSPVSRIALSESGQKLCIVRASGRLTIHDTESGVQEQTALHTNGAFTSVTWSHDERLFAVAEVNGLIHLYDAATLMPLWGVMMESPHHSNCPTAIAISPDGQSIAVGMNTSSEIYVWDIREAKIPRRLQGHTGIVRSCQFCNVTGRLYSGSYDGTIREWDLNASMTSRLID